MGFYKYCRILFCNHILIINRYFQISCNLSLPKYLMFESWKVRFEESTLWLLSNPSTAAIYTRGQFKPLIFLVWYSVRMKTTNVSSAKWVRQAIHELINIYLVYLHCSIGCNCTQWYSSKKSTQTTKCHQYQRLCYASHTNNPNTFISLGNPKEMRNHQPFKKTQGKYIKSNHLKKTW